MPAGTISTFAGTVFSRPLHVTRRRPFVLETRAAFCFTLILYGSTSVTSRRYPPETLTNTCRAKQPLHHRAHAQRRRRSASGALCCASATAGSNAKAKTKASSFASARDAPGHSRLMLDVNCCVCSRLNRKAQSNSLFHSLASSTVMRTSSSSKAVRNVSSRYVHS